MNDYDNVRKWNPFCQSRIFFQIFQNVKMWKALYAGMITYLTTFKMSKCVFALYAGMITHLTNFIGKKESTVWHNSTCALQGQRLVVRWDQNARCLSRFVGIKRKHEFQFSSNKPISLWWIKPKGTTQNLRRVEWVHYKRSCFLKT